MDAFVGEIRLFPYTFPPAGWEPCDGRVLNIQQYQVLYVVISSIYTPAGKTPPSGGFYLPNLQAETAPGEGSGPGLTPRILGQPIPGGAASVTLTQPQMTQHNHTLNGSFENDVSVVPTSAPTATSWFTFPQTPIGGSNLSANAYGATPPAAYLAPTVVGTTGGGGAHENQQPYLAMGYFICWDGTFPSPP